MRLVHGRLRLADPGVRVRGGGMVFRTAGAVATLLIGLGGAGGSALAQYYPAPPQGYQPAQADPPPQGAYRQLPPVAEADEAAPSYGSPTIQSTPLPPAGVAPQAAEPPAGAPYGRGGPAYPEEAALPPPPGTV